MSPTKINPGTITEAQKLADVMIHKQINEKELSTKGIFLVKEVKKGDIPLGKIRDIFTLVQRGI